MIQSVIKNHLGGAVALQKTELSYDRNVVTSDLRQTTARSRQTAAVSIQTPKTQIKGRPGKDHGDELAALPFPLVNI